ncbi:hypothetical protein F5X98DRAFT_344189 [Xylaria grammica]|nr:hypothetical protein F5X98DRAFT_344189 [Xylaria grammica]
MSVPNHSVVPMTEDDIPAITKFLQDSKLQLAINRFLISDWPNPPFQKAHYGGVIERSLPDRRMTCLKVINDATKEPVAHLFYSRLPSHPEDQGSKKVPAGFVPDVYRTVMDFSRELKPSFDTEEYIDLTHLYVEPSSRGLGIGSWLLGIAQGAATEAKLPFSLCSEPTHHGFFVSRGLRDLKTVDVDLRKWAPPASGYGIFRMSRMAPAE